MYFINTTLILTLKLIINNTQFSELNSVPSKIHVGVLTPRHSERNSIWRLGLEEVIR